MQINSDALRTIRERSGLSQTDLADAVGVDRSTISRLEAGERNAAPWLVDHLATALKCPIPALINGKTTS